MAEAQARPAMATTARTKRGRAVARVAHAGHACYGATHNPHWSSHYPGYVAVQGETTCWNHSVSVTTHLYKWIFGAWYFRDAASNSGWQTTRVSAKWNGNCGWWLGTSGHSATFHYPAGTSNQAYVPC
jgi:hypothetical protein